MGWLCWGWGRKNERNVCPIMYAPWQFSVSYLSCGWTRLLPHLTGGTADPPVGEFLAVLLARCPVEHIAGLSSFNIQSPNHCMNYLVLLWIPPSPRTLRPRESGGPRERSLSVPHHHHLHYRAGDQGFARGPRVEVVGLWVWGG